MREGIAIGNWKMNNTIPEAIKLITEVQNNLSGVRGIQIVVAPAFTALHSVAIALKDSPIKLASQDISSVEKGARTGEISAEMLTDTGCQYVIIGHSERRQFLKESNSDINEKITRALDEELIPIFCVGETQDERDQDKTQDVIETQLREGLRGIKPTDFSDIIIAYEPVWAIGTGKTATPEDAESVHQFIRSVLKTIFGNILSKQLRIIYGGSVSPSNIATLYVQENIDGALIGGASLDAHSFTKIISLMDNN